MQAFWNNLQNVVWNVFNRMTVADLADILIMAFLVYQVMVLIHETRASAVIKGLFILLIADLLSQVLGLTSLNWLFTGIVKNGAIVLMILFQPELRKALEQLGRGTFRLSSRTNEKEESEKTIREITECLLHLSARRVGALIVFERQIGLKDVIETGTELNARISAPLLENIFEPNTPLHDGAVVIRGHSVKAAACILTLTESKGVDRNLGTRHRAALGVTETTDAVSLVVSEETGIISMAEGGKIIRRLDREAIEKKLGEMYRPENVRLFPRLIRKDKSGKEDEQ